MSESKIFEGRTTNEAIEKGLKEFKAKREDVEIKVLENEEKRSFFSILTPRVVKVEIKVLEKNSSNNNEEKKEKHNIEITDESSLQLGKKNLEDFLNHFIKMLPSNNLKYTIEIENPFIKVNIDGDDLNYLIGHRGETLNSLQTILSTIAEKNVNRKVRVIVDILNYKEKREKVLEDLAVKLSKTVIRTKKSVTLEPMTAYERRIIHTKLQDNSKVKTSSVGEEPYRKVVISLK